MKQVPIGDCVSEVRKWNPAKEASSEIISYIDIASVSQTEKVVNGISEFIGGEAPSRARQLVTTGDILVSTVRPNLNGVARIPERLDGATGSTGFCVLRPIQNRIDGRYLFHWVRTPTFISSMVKQATGQSYPAVSEKIIKASKIPLPPLEDQKRIAAILDQADHLRRLRQRAIDRLNTLGQAIFYEMFGDPTTNPKEFVETGVQELCQVVTDCLHTTPNHSSDVSPYPSIRSSELQGGFIDLSTAKYVTEQEYNQRNQRHIPTSGDVIYCREGARFGNAGIIPEGMTPCLGQRTMLFQAKSDVASPEYLWAVLTSSWTYKQAAQKVGGAASPHVNIRDIRQFRCLLPPIELQREFGTATRIFFNQRKMYLNQNEHFSVLFKSLQQRAFKGEL